MAHQIYARDKMLGAAERREKAEELRLIEQAKIAKQKAEEAKTRDKKAKDQILEMKAAI